jgi:hypothetical protein
MTAQLHFEANLPAVIQKIMVAEGKEIKKQLAI